MLVPVVHALVPEAETTDASEELLPNEYNTNERLIVPAPLLVALKPMDMAMSISDKFICAGK